MGRKKPTEKDKQADELHAEEKAARKVKKAENSGKLEDKKVENILEKKDEKSKKEKLLERAKELEKFQVKTEDIKEQLEKERKTLVPVEEYIKHGCYIGTKVITPHMRGFVYKRRNDGIAILDVNKIDARLKEFIKILNQYKPEDFIIACKREAGWNAVKRFSELTGVRIFTKKYPAGILTNPVLPNFFETEMVFVIDPWLDKNAMNDSKIIRKPVLALCDTNNYTFGIDHFIPCNNKANKSIGLILYVLAREYLKARKIEKELPSIEVFVGEEQEA